MLVSHNRKNLWQQKTFQLMSPRPEAGSRIEIHAIVDFYVVGRRGISKSHLGILANSISLEGAPKLLSTIDYTGYPPSLSLDPRIGQDNPILGKWAAPSSTSLELQVPDVLKV